MKDETQKAILKTLEKIDGRLERVETDVKGLKEGQKRLENKVDEGFEEMRETFKYHEALLQQSFEGISDVKRKFFEEEVRAAIKKSRFAKK